MLLFSIIFLIFGIEYLISKIIERRDEKERYLKMLEIQHKEKVQ